MKNLFTFLILVFTINASAQNGLSFDGQNDYVQTSIAGPTGNSSRTVEAWIKLGPLVSLTQQVVVNWGDMSNGHRYTLNVIGGIPRIEVGGSGFSAPNALSSNAWHHIAGVYDSIANQLRLVVDGSLAASGTPTVTVATSNINPIIIGRRVDSINYFSGSVDEVRIWNVARSVGQISADMNHEFCTTNANLVSYYKFNQGIAGGNNAGVTMLLDFSANNNNGVLNGFALTGSTSNWVTGKPLTGNSNSSINAFACNSYTSPSGLYTWTTTGQYHDTIPNALGCDSIITIVLTVTTIDTSVSQAGMVLTSNTAGATYQWLDCSNNYAALPGATLQNYTATSNGSYAVQISKNGCMDTSDCHAVTSAGLIENMHLTFFDVYPNPFQDKINIRFLADAKNQSHHLKLFNLQGEIIFEEEANAINAEIVLNKVAPGFYFLEVSSNGNSYRKKLIKE